MTQKPRPDENRKGKEEVAESKDSAPLRNFKAVTRQILGVSHKQIEEEQRRFDAKQKQKKG